MRLAQGYSSVSRAHEPFVPKHTKNALQEIDKSLLFRLLGLRRKFINDKKRLLDTESFIYKLRAIGS